MIDHRKAILFFLLRQRMREFGGADNIKVNPNWIIQSQPIQTSKDLLHFFSRSCPPEISLIQFQP